MDCHSDRLGAGTNKDHTNSILVLLVVLTPKLVGDSNSCVRQSQLFVDVFQ